MNHQLKGSVSKTIPVELSEDEPRPLTPVVVSGSRSGTTLMMKLLGGDGRCVYDQVYPLECCYLRFILYFVNLVEGRDFGSKVTESLHSSLGVFPTLLRPLAEPDATLLNLPSARELYSTQWQAFSDSIRKNAPEARFYAEKVQLWEIPYLQRFDSPYVIYCIRDPRDVFLSSCAYIKKHALNILEQEGPNWPMNSRYALGLASLLLAQYENFRAFRETSRSMVVRYEDLIADTKGTVEKLSAAIGIESVNFSADQFYEHHKTTDGPESSINRWKGEDLASEFSRCFERTMASEMQELGYDCPAPAPETEAIQIDFSTSESIARLVHMDFAGNTVSSPEYGLQGLKIPLCGDSSSCLIDTCEFMAEDYEEIWLSVAGGAGHSLTLSWAGENCEFEPDSVVTVPAGPGEHYRIIRFPVSSNERWLGKIRLLSLSIAKMDKQPCYDPYACVRLVRFVPRDLEASPPRDRRKPQEQVSLITRITGRLFRQYRDVASN